MQRSATKLNDVEQLSLPIGSPLPSAVARTPDLVHVASLSSVQDVMVYAMQLGKVVPKQLFGPMGTTKSVWSRILSGEFELGCGAVKKFNTAVRNDSLLLWLNHDHGYDIRRMVRIKNDVEQRLEAAEARIRELEREREIQIAFVQDALSARK